MYPNFIMSFISSTTTPHYSDDSSVGGGVSKSNDANELGTSARESCKDLMPGTSGNSSFHLLHHQNTNGSTGTNWATFSGNPSGRPAGEEEGILHHNTGVTGNGHNLDNYDNNEYHHSGHHSAASVSTSDVASNYDAGFEGFCPKDYDDILCWPKTAVGQVATLPCFDNLYGIPYNASGFAKRVCLEGGKWNTTEYSECKPFIQLHSNMTTDTGNLDITTGIYLFGYCLSLIALIIAAVFFITFKELRCLRNTIHSHLMVTYVLADALWVLSVISTDQGRNVRHTTQATCFTFILLHYFHLTNFFWMFVEGLYLYVLVVQTFMTESIRLRTYCVIGWGLPLLIVLLWTVTKWATLNDEELRKIMLNEEIMAEVELNSVVCPWLHANQYDWIYNSSALIVLAANLVFLLQIMWVLITKLRSATSQETQQSRKAAKALVVLMPLLGITYVLLLIGPKKWPAYEHIRAFLLSTQGFLVALLYCFLNAEVRMAIRHRWNRLEWSDACKDFLCCCCPYKDSSQNIQNYRDSSPRSRTESIRLYTPTSQIFRKRESTASETTTMTALTTGTSLNGGGGGCNISSNLTMAGNGSAPVPTTIIASIQGKKISTSVRLPTTFAEESDLV